MSFLGYLFSLRCYSVSEGLDLGLDCAVLHSVLRQPKLLKDVFVLSSRI